MKKYNYLIKAFISFFVFYYSSYFQYIAYYLFHTKNSVILNTFSNVCLMIILIFIYKDELIKEWKIFKNNKLECINTGFTWWCIGFITMIASNLLIMHFFHATGAENEKMVQKMIQSLPWLMLINAGFIASFNEEIIFRKVFKNLFKNKWLFIILSGLVFGFLHVYSSINSIADLLYIIPYGFFGACFAVAYTKTNTFFTSYFFHMFHNISLITLSIILYTI